MDTITQFMRKVGRIDKAEGNVQLKTFTSTSGSAKTAIEFSKMYSKHSENKKVEVLLRINMKNDPEDPAPGFFQLTEGYTDFPHE